MVSEQAGGRRLPVARHWHRVAMVVAAVAMAAAGEPARAVTTVPQVRHLIYSFTWGTTNQTEVHTSGMPDSASGGGGSGGMLVAAPGSTGSASGISSFGGERAIAAPSPWT